MPNKLEIVSAYRNLYRGLLKAVQYSSPARKVARDQLRLAFRDPVVSTATGTPAWDAEGIKRTKWFLDAAAKEKGIEHKILKNLIKVRFLASKDRQTWKRALHETRAKYVVSHLLSSPT